MSSPIGELSVFHKDMQCNDQPKVDHSTRKTESIIISEANLTHNSHLSNIGLDQKNRVITLTNHKRHRQPVNQSKLEAITRS